MRALFAAASGGRSIEGFSFLRGTYRLLSTGPASGTDASPVPGPTTATPQRTTARLVVFGGRGFVGTAVCKEALVQGFSVAAISPSGTPPAVHEPWMSEVQYLRGNALEPRTYLDVLDGAAGVVSCVGAFGSNEHMRRINGTANATLIETAAAADVPRFAYISAHIPFGMEYVLKGYVDGKHAAEAALFAAYPARGVALRPFVIYGNRVVNTTLTLPLGMVFKPVEGLMRRVPNRQSLADLPVVGSAFLPTVSVEAVARAAVAAALDDNVPGGIMDDWTIATQYERE